MIKKQAYGSFVSVDVTRRTRKSKFFHQIDTLIDWKVFEKELYKGMQTLYCGGSRQACLQLVVQRLEYAQRYTHLPRHAKKAKRALRKLRTIAGRQVRDLQRQLAKLGKVDRASV